MKYGKLLMIIALKNSLTISEKNKRLKMHKNWLYYTLLGLIVMISFSCNRRILDKSYDHQKAKRLYSEGIGDAAKPQPWEISSNLTAINKKNSGLIRKEIDGAVYILVSSWKADTTFYKNDQKSGAYNTGKFPIWVTLSPELQVKCSTKKFGRKEGLGIYLDGVNLDEDVYKNSDSNVVVSEIKKLTNDNSEIVRF